MRVAVLLAFALGGCASQWGDVHAPKTVVAPEAGGAVTVNHGDRLRIPLASDPAAGYEWRRVEPQVLMVVAEGPPEADGMNFTPVRSGDEQLRLEYSPLSGRGTAQRTVSYDITVPQARSR
jgi:predicted secreted protein